MKIYIQCIIATAVAPLALARIRGSDSDAREIDQINNTLRLDRNLGIGFIDNDEGQEPKDEAKSPDQDKNGKSMKDGKSGKSDKSKKEKEEKSKSGKSEKSKSGKSEKSKSGKSEKEKKAKVESTNISKMVKGDKKSEGDTVVKKDKADPSPKEDKASSR